MNNKSQFFKITVSYLLLILWAIVIFGFSANDANHSTQQSNLILTIIAKITHIEIEENAFWAVTETVVRKLAHFSIYFILGILSINAFRFNIKKHLVLISIIFCFLYSVSDEIHQAFVPERACRVYDMLVDTLGASLGVFVYPFLRKPCLKLFKRSDSIEKA